MRVDELILPAPAEAVAVAIINQGLKWFTDKATVSVGYPIKDARHVKIVLTGGRTPNLVTDEATFAIECWDTDGIEAETLASRVAAIMRASPGSTYAGHFVRSWAFASRPQNFPVPDSRMYRYQFAGALGIRPTIQAIPTDTD